jgi:hypothetical protein
MHIDSNQKVGIGTTSPVDVLDIVVGTDARAIFSDAIASTGTGNLTIQVSNSADDALKPFGIRAEDIRMVIGSTEAMRIDSSGNVGIGASSIDNIGAANTVLEIRNSSGLSPWIHFTNSVSGNGTNDGQLIGTEGIHTYYINRENGTQRFHTNNTERMRIDSSGTVGINNSSPSGCKLEVSYANADVGMVVSTTDTFSSGNSSLIQFKEVDTVGGSIVFTNGGTTTAYVTSSDYRLKENVSYEFDATTRLKQLKPCRFNFKKTPDITVDGFLAHEVTAVPEAITGEKDAMTEEVLYIDGDDVPEGKKVGDVKTPSQIDPQGIDQSKLVPLLTKALQEAVAKIETLEAKVTALESK